MKAPVTLVTTFGLGRTPAQVGMLEVVAQKGIRPDTVVGSSLGAVNAAGLAAGCHPAQLQEFWEWLLAEVMTSPVRTLAKGLSARQSRKQVEMVRSRVAALLPARFDQLSIPLRLAATDLETGDAVVLDSGDLVEAVMASCALPGLLPPVDVGGAHLIDGGLVAGVPLRAVPEETKTVIVLDTGHAAMPEDALAGYRWWEVAALSYAHQIREQAVNALLVSATKTPVVMVSTAHGRLLDVSDPAGSMRAGRQAAEEQLATLPPRLRRGVYNLPAGLADYGPLADLAVEPR
ncbi:MAG: patatin-like phospholipase family protein [Candidatus Nanopelagicales bacterium]|nr:patatin-like phospholipase family protein [Actinomycetota bacterium]